MRLLPRLTLVICLIITFAIALTPSPARAADATVTNCTNFTGAGTISDAMSIVNVAPGGTITFACSTVTPIIFTSQFNIVTNVTINANDNTVVFDDGGNNTRFFQIFGGAISLTLNGFTLQNGNVVSANGGAITVDTNGSLTVNNSTFAGNSASGGGAIYNDGGTVTISNSTFTGNSATSQGGAIHNFGTATISTSTFTGNSATLSGGAIYTVSGTATITNSAFTGNSATLSGGAIANDGITLTISTSTFTGNSATNGGAIFNGFTASSQDSHYENNTCFGTITGTGNTVISATGCPGSAPIALSVSAITCNGNNAVFTINAGDGDFAVTGTSGNFPPSDVPAGLVTLTGPSTWANITVTERRGEREFIPLGGITCPSGVITPPTITPPSTSTVTVLGCALDSTDGVEVAGAPDNTYCRVLMKNGGVVSYSGAIPAELIGLGVKLAVDVYRLQGGATINTFPDYARICLSGTGRYFYMDGRNAPRVSVEMPAERVDGLTCAWIPAPGTVILTN